MKEAPALLGGAGVALPVGVSVAPGGGLVVLPDGDGPGVGGDGGLA